MIKLPEFNIDPQQLISINADVLKDIYEIIASVPWDEIARVLAFILVGILCLDVIFFVNDRIIASAAARRVREHHLTIRNNGNTPSIFMLRPMGLPKDMAIDFYSGGNPMICVTRKKKNEEPAAEKASEKPASQAGSGSPAGGKNNAGGALIPDLSDPMKPVDTVRNAATEVGKKTGLIAAILGTIASLLPFRSKALQDGANSLKNVQQTSSQTVGTINNKINSADTLKRQVGNLGPKNADAGKLTAKAGEIRLNAGEQDPGIEPGEASAYNTPSYVSDFVYDEKVWKKNRGKTDEKGGSLNYAQSQLLKPGESVRIDMKIREWNSDVESFSRLYKIEIWQIPQTDQHFAAPRQSVSGIVTFSRISHLDRFIPMMEISALIILMCSLIAVCSKFLFSM